jgi:N-acetylglucosamine kinase-like BadF-type ATPase
MSGLIVGLDAGATKLAVRIEREDGTRVLDTAVPASDWEAEPTAAAVQWLLARLRPLLPPDEPVAVLGLGAQGCDNPEVAAELAAGLAAAGLPGPVVNDAALLVPAAGFDAGIGLIAGTGAIGVGTTADGSPLAAGGWGWVLGDDAGAVGVVREAVKSALSAHDAGVADDGLLGALLAAYGVPNAERLARVVNDEPTIENWAPHAPAVFAAADAGSALAQGIVTHAADHLVKLVDQLRARGAVGAQVVAAGSVIVRQPRLRDAVAAALAQRHPELGFTLLADAPVAGAVALARRHLAGRPLAA